MSWKIVLVSVFFLTVPFFVSAQSASDNTVRAQCFDTLKENMAETTIFSLPLQTLATTTYADLESKFSKNYTGLSSFGIDIDRPDLEMRLYSFGRQTGYQHPPKLPLPSSTKSELWGETSKEYIVAEEYITDNNQQKHFIDCVFFQISGQDLMQITRERYLYDGALISITKTPQTNDYKAWYSENVSFDYKSKPFATWRRLFVYPKATQNTYFSKYDAQDAFPAHQTTSFSSLAFKNSSQGPVMSSQDYDEKGNVSIKYFAPNVTGEIVEVAYPDELKPVVSDGADKRFPLATYYQSIENLFPEFAKRLSFRGTLQYDTFKKLLTSPSLDAESQKLLNTLLDPRGLAAYSVSKERAASFGTTLSNPQFDTVFGQVQNADKAFADIQNKINDQRNASYLKIFMEGMSIVITISLIGYALYRVIQKRRIASEILSNDNHV